MKKTYKTTEKSTAKLVKCLEKVINQFRFVTYVDMTEDPVILKAKKLIKSLEVKS